MSAALLIAALLVGLSLGLLGGGGSILMLPSLVYAAGLELSDAVPTALVVVGFTSAVSVVSHARAGDVDFARGGIFGLTGMVGSALGARLSVVVPEPVTLVLFALAMVVTAARMLRRAEPAPCPSCSPVRAIVLGALVGVFSGLTGAGGGFLIVPALVHYGGLGIRKAIGTSLLVIAMQSLSGAAMHLLYVSLDLALLGYIALASAGAALVGARLSRLVARDRLGRAFGWFVLALGLFMGMRQVPMSVVESLVNSPLSPIAGGVLIGLSATLLWVSHGRTAGVSGIVGGLLVGSARGDRAFRVAFVLGLVVGGLALSRVLPHAFSQAPVSLGTTLVAGALVGVGTTLGNGCTSGHGVCGIARMSQRSLLATAVFVAMGMVMVYVARHVVGVSG